MSRKAELPPLSFSDLGKSIGQSEHWSISNRYQAIYDVLTLPELRLRPELSSVRTLLLRGEVLSIQDCAAGTSQAIVSLGQALCSRGRRVEISAYDLKDPREIVFEPFGPGFESIVSHSGILDATSPPRWNKRYNLSILGYLHPYLSAELFQQAVLYRLEESDVVAVIPAGDRPLSPQACRFIYWENETIKSVIYDPDRKKRR